MLKSCGCKVEIRILYTYYHSVYKMNPEYQDFYPTAPTLEPPPHNPDLERCAF